MLLRASRVPVAGAAGIAGPRATRPRVSAAKIGSLEELAQSGRWSPGRWTVSQKPTTLLAIRLLLVANSFVLTAIGALYLASAARPGGVIVAAVVWSLAALLLSAVRFTNPRRGDPSRW